MGQAIGKVGRALTWGKVRSRWWSEALMAEGLAEVPHRVMVEATGRKPKTKPPVPNETAPQKSYPPRLKSPEYLRRKSAPRHARPDYLAAKGPLRPPSSTSSASAHFFTALNEVLVVFAGDKDVEREVRPTGSRGWMQRLTIRGRRTELGLGGFPLDEKRRTESMPTFAEAAGQVWNQLRPGWRSPEMAQPGAICLPSNRRDAGLGGDECRRDRDCGPDLAREGYHIVRGRFSRRRGRSVAAACWCFRACAEGRSASPHCPDCSRGWGSRPCRTAFGPAFGTGPPRRGPSDIEDGLTSS